MEELHSYFLKSCPFCESEAYLHHDTSGDYKSHHSYGVYCKNEAGCNASNECWYSKTDAIEAWNRRPNEDK